MHTGHNRQMHEFVALKSCSFGIDVPPRFLKISANLQVFFLHATLTLVQVSSLQSW